MQRPGRWRLARRRPETAERGRPMLRALRPRPAPKSAPAMRATLPRSPARSAAASSTMSRGQARVRRALRRTDTRPGTAWPAPPASAPASSARARRRTAPAPTPTGRLHRARSPALARRSATPSRAEFSQTRARPGFAPCWQYLAFLWRLLTVSRVYRRIQRDQGGLPVMRNIRSRIALFFNVKTSAALDQVEDPREVLDYAYGQQQFHQRTVKRGLIEVAAARRQLERHAERLGARASHLEDQARRALRSNREDLARAALARRQTALAEIRALEDQFAEMAREEERLTLADQQMTQRVERFRVHRTVASARYAAAEAQVTVGEALAGLVGDEEIELSLAVERSDERIDRLHARAVAIDALTESGALLQAPGEDPLERELNEVTNAEAVEAELAELKRQLETESPPEGTRS